MFLGVQVLGFRDWVLGSGVLNSGWGFRFQGFSDALICLGFALWGSGFAVCGVGCRLWGVGFWF